MCLCFLENEFDFYEFWCGKLIVLKPCECHGLTKKIHNKSMFNFFDELCDLVKDLKVVLSLKSIKIVLRKILLMVTFWPKLLSEILLSKDMFITRNCVLDVKLITWEINPLRNDFPKPPLVHSVLTSFCVKGWSFAKMQND